MATALQWVTNVGLLTPTDGSVIGPNLEMENGNLRMLSLEPRHLAVRVGAARGADLVTCEPSAVAEGVSSGAPGTAADGYMVQDTRSPGQCKVLVLANEMPITWPQESWHGSTHL